MTLNLSCRQLFKSGQKEVRVFGPFEDVEHEVRTICVCLNNRYWRITLRSGRGTRLRSSRKLPKNNKFEKS